MTVPSLPTANKSLKNINILTLLLIMMRPLSHTRDTSSFNSLQLLVFYSRYICNFHFCSKILIKSKYFDEQNWITFYGICFFQFY